MRDCRRKVASDFCLHKIARSNDEQSNVPAIRYTTRAKRIFLPRTKRCCFDEVDFCPFVHPVDRRCGAWKTLPERLHCTVRVIVVVWLIPPDCAVTGTVAVPRYVCEFAEYPQDIRVNASRITTAMLVARPRIALSGRASRFQSEASTPIRLSPVRNQPVPFPTIPRACK